MNLFGYEARAYA